MLTEKEKFILRLAYGKNKDQKLQYILDKPVVFQKALVNYILLKANIGKGAEPSRKKRRMCREIFLRQLDKNHDPNETEL